MKNTDIKNMDTQKPRAENKINNERNDKINNERKDKRSKSMRQIRNTIIVLRSNIGDIDPVNLEHMFNVFGLSQNEKILVHATSGRMLSTTEVAELTGLPRVTVHGIATRLEKRRLMTREQTHVGKIPAWKSDLRQTIRYLETMPLWPVPENDA